MEQLTKVVVITRYREYIDWIKYIISKVDFIYIYNKGPDENYFKFTTFNETDLQKLKFIPLPNIGRIDHTLTFHILQHWNNLPDVLINLPASVMMCHKKGYYLNGIMRALPFIKSKYKGFCAARFKHIKHDNYNFSLSNYQAEGRCNRNNNPFIKSEYPDLITWKKALIDDRPIHHIAMRGMFAVCKENILHIKKEVYINLLSTLSVGDNIENGHFAERIWGHLFYQYIVDNKLI